MVQFVIVNQADIGRPLYYAHPRSEREGEFRFSGELEDAIKFPSRFLAESRRREEELTAFDIIRIVHPNHLEFLERIQ